MTIRMRILGTILALLPVAIVLWTTGTHGLGVTADSVVYLNAATSAASGKGFLDVDAAGQPMALLHAPPLFPAVLAVGNTLLKVEPLDGARWLNALLMALTALLLMREGQFLKLGTAWSVAVPIMGLTSIVVFKNYLFALSEGLFLFLTFSALYAIFRYAIRSTGKWLVFAAALSGAAVLTRHAGVALILSGTAVILSNAGPARRKKLWHAAAFCALAGFPMLVWIGYQSLVTAASHPLEEKAALYLGNSSILRDAARAVAVLILPSAVPAAVPLTMLLAGAGISLYLLSRAHALDEAQQLRLLLSRVLLWFVFSYALMLAASQLFIYHDIVLDDRILSILVVPALTVAACAVVTAGTAHRKASYALLAILALFFTANVYRTGALILTAHRRGLGYTASVWRDSSVLKEAGRLTSDTAIYSNLPSAVRFISNHPAAMLPVAYDTRLDRRNDAYQSELNQIFERVRAGQAAIVCLGSPASSQGCAQALDPSARMAVLARQGENYLLLGSAIQTTVWKAK